MRSDMVACAGSRQPSTPAIEVVYPEGIYAACPTCQRHVETRGTTTRTLAVHYVYREQPFDRFTMTSPRDVE